MGQRISTKAFGILPFLVYIKTSNGNGSKNTLISQDFEYLFNKNFEWKWVKEYPYKSWDFAYYLSKRENFEWKWVKEYPHKLPLEF